MNVFDFAKDLLFKMKYEQQGSSIGSVSYDLVTLQVCSMQNTYVHLIGPDYLRHALHGRARREKSKQLQLLTCFYRELCPNFPFGLHIIIVESCGF